MPAPASDYRPQPLEGFEDQPDGVDVITEPALVRRHFPYLAEDTVAVLHARRCGWFSGQQLGMYMLERAREKGVRLVEGRVTRVETTGGRVREVTVEGAGGRATIGTGRFVNAGGPFLRAVGRLLGVDIPVFSERHAKASFTTAWARCRATRLSSSGPIRCDCRGRTRSAASSRTRRSTGGSSTSSPPASTGGRKAAATARWCFSSGRMTSSPWSRRTRSASTRRTRRSCCAGCRV